jgi:biotin carboxyl carrier protein
MNKIAVSIDGHAFEVEVRQNPANRSEFTAKVDGEEIQVYVPEPDFAAPIEWLVVDRRPYEVSFDRTLHWIQSSGHRHQLDIRDREVAAVRPAGGDGRVKAPIPGLITRVHVTPGQTVVPGQSLLILEAMKMENEIRAPRGGTVQQINVQPGQGVTLNELLVEIA